MGDVKDSFGHVVLIRGVARTVRVTAGSKDALIRVSERNDDRSPMVEDVVECKDRALLSAVRIHGSGERGRRLICERTFLPDSARRIDELLELCRGHAKPCRRSKSESIGPLEVLERRFLDVLRGHAVVVPTLLRRDDLVWCELAHFAQARLCADGLSALLERTREFVRMAIGTIVDDCNLCQSSPAFPIVRPQPYRA